MYSGLYALFNVSSHLKVKLEMLEIMCVGILVNKIQTTYFFSVEKLLQFFYVNLLILYFAASIFADATTNICISHERSPNYYV